MTEVATDGMLRKVDEARADAFIPTPVPQNHAASLTRLQDGSLACVRFGGTMEGMPDFSIHMSVFDEADQRWSMATKFTDNTVRSEQNPLLHVVDDRTVWLLHTSQISGNQDTSVVRRRISTDGGKTFGEPHTMIDAPGTFIRQRIITRQTGDLLLPVFLCRTVESEAWTGNRDVSGVYRSSDGGDTWRLTEVPHSLGHVHMSIVPQGGSGMVAFYRSRWADFIHRSRSDDDGVTWTAPEPTALPNNNSSIQCVRLTDGRLAVIYNHSSAANAEGRRTSLYDEIEGNDVTPAAALHLSPQGH